EKEIAPAAEGDQASRSNIHQLTPSERGSGTVKDNKANVNEKSQCTMAENPKRSRGRFWRFIRSEEEEVPKPKKTLKLPKFLKKLFKKAKSLPKDSSDVISELSFFDYSEILDIYEHLDRYPQSLNDYDFISELGSGGFASLLYEGDCFQEINRMLARDPILLDTSLRNPNRQLNDLINKLISYNRVDRLGYTGAGSVKRHPYFSFVDWNQLPRPKEVKWDDGTIHTTLNRSHLPPLWRANGPLQSMEDVG
ncbi:hypothetical protein HDU67_001527, partial [Dinochytrium kinnereticum]